MLVTVRGPIRRRAVRCEILYAQLNEGSLRENCSATHCPPSLVSCLSGLFNLCNPLCAAPYCICCSGRPLPAGNSYSVQCSTTAAPKSLHPLSPSVLIHRALPNHHQPFAGRPCVALCRVCLRVCARLTGEKPWSSGHRGLAPRSRAVPTKKKKN